jgi:hypothetical protein
MLIELMVNKIWGMPVLQEKKPDERKHSVHFPRHIGLAFHL